jgi:hypothetical protein
MSIAKRLNYGNSIAGIKTRVVVYAATVEKRIASKTKRVLFKTGAYTRKSMQRSMRYRKGPSQPGQPPSAHRDGRGPLLRRLIGFEVDRQRDSVTIGPQRFGKLSQPSGKTVPDLVNDGGTITATLEGRTVTAELEARPFTAPAFTDGGARFQELIAKEQL